MTTRPNADVRALFETIQRCFREFQNNRAYLNIKRNLEYPFTRNSEVDVLLSWERFTQITLEKLEIHLGTVDYGSDKRDALGFVDQNHPPFKYKEEGA